MEVAASPDGRSVYAVTEDFDLLAYSADPATGALTRIKGRRGCFTIAPRCTFLKGLSTPEDVRVSADGRMTGIELSPDNRHAYMLETEAGFGRAVGVVQVLRRR